MRGILIDVNLRGQLARVRSALESPYWNELWRAFEIPLLTFEEASLSDESADDVIWRLCESEKWILITGNRNKSGPTSLEETIRKESSLSSLPVFTIGDPELLMRSSEYVERVVGKLLDFLEDIENLRGTGRLYLP